MSHALDGVSGDRPEALLEILRTAREHEVQGRRDEAIALFQAIACRQDDGSRDAARIAIEALVSLRMRSLEIDEAQQAFAAFLERQFILPGPAAKDGLPRLLVLHGLQSWEAIQFDSFFHAFPFSINAGHFDAAALLATCQLPRDAAFVTPDPLSDDSLARKRGQLRSYPVVLNLIADADAEASTLAQATRLLEGYPGRVLNRPAAVEQTARDRAPRLLTDCPELVVPRVERYASLDAAALERRLADAPQGLIVRPVGSQTGRGMQRLGARDGIPSTVDAMAGRPAFVIDFHDFADASAYVKMRMFLVGGQLYPEHRIAADVWNIHSAERAQRMRRTPELELAEARFLADPAQTLGVRTFEALHAALSRFELDYIGIDFAQLADGRILVFETNPAMRVNYDHCGDFAYLKPHLDRIAEAFSLRAEGLAGFVRDDSIRTPPPRAA